MGCSQSSASDFREPGAKSRCSLQTRARSNSRFDLQDALGEGCFATVFEGYCKSTGTGCAIKVMDTQSLKCSAYSASPSEAERLQKMASNEVELWAKLGQHQHCIALLDSFQEHGLHFMIMEVCEGGCLLDIAEEIRGMAKSGLSDLVQGMLLGIDHCHNTSIVHRDVKPENFLLSRPRTVKLCDFGMAVVALRGALSLVGACGTGPFMSPEMAAEEPYDDKTDIWSLGVTLYDLLLGCFPYPGVECDDVKEHIIQGVPPPAYEAINGACTLSKPFEALIQSCLNRQAGQRLSSLQALRHETLNDTA